MEGVKGDWLHNEPEQVLFLFLGQILLFGVLGSLLELLIVGDDGLDYFVALLAGLHRVYLLWLELLGFLQREDFSVILALIELFLLALLVKGLLLHRFECIVSHLD